MVVWSLLLEAWHVFRGRHRTSAFMYSVGPNTLNGIIKEDGSLLIYAAREAPPGTIPIKGPQEVYVQVDAKYVPLLKQWFGNMKASEGVTYVDKKTLAVPNKK